MAFPSHPALLIATLGTEPQVVTAALNLLWRQGEPIDRVSVIHTTDPDNPSISEAFQRLQQAFTEPPYKGQAELASHPLEDERGRPLSDVDSPAAGRAAFRLIYRLVRQAKLEGLNVHLSIAGGRKTLAVFGMATAQLLFDAEDRLWHLYSAGDFLQSKRLNPRPEDEVHLISIPLILWSQVSPILTPVAQTDDPYEAAERARAMQLSERLETARSFVLGALTPAERRVTELLVREGLSDAQLAARLSLSPRTIERHLRSAYDKAVAHWDLPDAGRAQLVALLNFYFVTQG